MCDVYCVSDTRNEGGNYWSEMVRKALEFQRQQHAMPLKVRQQHTYIEKQQMHSVQKYDKSVQ